MNYLKGLFAGFLLVFFANYLLPGIEVTDQSKLPHVGADLFFALILGTFNALIYLLLKLFKQEASVIKIGLIALVLNFVSYALPKFLSMGIHIVHAEGYLLAAATVAIGSFVINFLEMKKDRTAPPDLFH